MILLGDTILWDTFHPRPEILPANIPPEHAYQIFCKDRKETVDKRGGGMIVMVKPGLPAEECLDLDSNCEIKWVKINTSNLVAELRLYIFFRSG